MDAEGCAPRNPERLALTRHQRAQAITTLTPLTVQPVSARTLRTVTFSPPSARRVAGTRPSGSGAPE